MLKLRSPESAFERIEEYLRERGSSLRRGDSRADLYLGYGLSEPLRRTLGAGTAGAVPSAPRGRGFAGRDRA